LFPSSPVGSHAPFSTLLLILVHLISLSLSINDPPFQAVKAAREKLSTIVKARLEAAANAGNHENVLRFIRLHQPLRLFDEGKAWFAAHLRKLVAKRAQESYDLLMERTGECFILFCGRDTPPFHFALSAATLTVLCVISLRHLGLAGRVAS